jgi:SAM-dependent methyltransferase
VSNYSAEWRMRWLSERVATPPKSILDVGGTPETYQPLRAIFPDARIVQANTLKIPAQPGAEVLRADLTCAPLKEGRFDLVFLGEIIEHVYNLPVFLDELVRVATDGATFAVTTPNLASWYSRIFFLAGHVPPAYTPYPFLRLGMGPQEWRKQIHSHDHIRVFTPAALVEALALHGMDTVWWSGVTGYGGKYRKLRKSVEGMLPRGLREGIVLLARVDKGQHAHRLPSRPKHSL